MSPALLRPSKVTSSHLQQDAIVYIRQSSFQQVMHHQSSTQLQYELRERLLEWGWSPPQIHLIDEDLGKSASGAQERPGFTRLVSMISMGQVGLLIGREASRLARSCSDWYRLLEICALFGTLIADADGVYDPTTYNDRLLLGLKGTMSEAELHLLKQRMHAGRRHKASRGELRFRLPMGYVWSEDGQILKDPHEHAQRTLALVFERFAGLGNLHATLTYLARHQILMPYRRHTSPGKGELDWRRPNRITLGNMLRHPIYAGAYVYGRRLGPDRVTASQDQWQALIRDHHDGYISWQDYERNVAQLEANRPKELGTPRPGAALLPGLLTCGRCGCRVRVSYQNRRVWRYECVNEMINYGGSTCQGLQGPLLDEWVASQVLEALAPASLELSLQALERIEDERAELEAQWALRLEQARYEAQRAQRQYDAVEPENRLVARTLEQRWNESLLALKTLERQQQEALAACRPDLDEAQRRQILDLAQQLPALWRAETTTTPQRQQIARAMLERVEVNVQGNTERVAVKLVWGGGQTTEALIRRPVARWAQLSYYEDVLRQLESWREEGVNSQEMLQRLNDHPEWYPPKCTREFNANSLMTLLGHARIHASSPSRPTNGCWTVTQLARELKMPLPTVYSWVKKGWIEATLFVSPKGKKTWTLHVEEEQLEELRARRKSSRAPKSVAAHLPST